MTKETPSLSDKRVRLNIQKASIPPQDIFGYIEEDIKQFIKEILDKIYMEIDLIDNTHANSSLEDIKTRRSRQLVAFHSVLCEIRNLVKQKAGRDLI